MTFVRRVDSNNIPPYPITIKSTPPISSIAPVQTPSNDLTPSSSPRGSFAPKYNGITGAKTRGEGQIGAKYKTSFISAERENYEKLTKSSGFNKLSEAEKKQMLDALATHPTDPGFADDLRHVAGSETFRKLDAEMKSEVINALVHQADAPKGSNTCADLVSKPGFGELTKDQQKALLRVTSGHADKYSDEARAALQKLFANPDFANGDAKKQGAMLKELLDKQSFLPAATTAPDGTFSAPGKRVPYTITGPANPNAKVKTYQIEIDGRKIPVTMHPAPTGKVHHSVDDVAKAIAAAPKESRDKIKSVLFEPAERPGAYMAANGDGTLHCYPIDSLPSEDFAASAVIHETGHMVSIAKWGDDAVNGAKWKTWRDAMAKDALSPSLYGHGKPTAKETAGKGSPVHDDFAESVLLYQRVKGTKQEAEMRRLFPERFKILDTMLK